MKLTLPYPPSKLNPNRRHHFMALANAKKAYRWECAVDARAQKLGRVSVDTLGLRITFHPPDKRRRDRDNLIAAFKAGQDALSDVTGIDDSKFDITYAPLGEPVKGGCVIVEIET